MYARTLASTQVYTHTLTDTHTHTNTKHMHNVSSEYGKWSRIHIEHKQNHRD